MTPLAVSTYDFSLFLHITAAVVGFGMAFAESIFFPVAMRMKNGVRNLPYLHRLQLTINQFFAGPALLIVIVTGIYQTDKLWEFDQAWIQAALALWVVLALLILAYFIPSDRKLLPMITAEIAAAGDRELTLKDLSPEYTRAGRRQGFVGALTGILLIVMIYIMVTKPGL